MEIALREDRYCSKAVEIYTVGVIKIVLRENRYCAKAGERCTGSCVFLLQLGKLEVLQLDGNQLSHTVEDTPDTFKGKNESLS
jgi:hypothetical protein